MSKVGIITFNNSLNCGSMLQAFALQEEVKKLGHDATIIDFANAGSDIMYKLIPRFYKKGIPRPGLIMPFLRALKYYKYKKKEQLDYMYFKYTYMNLTPKLYSTEQELSQEDFDFTHYISGSDQIWNVNCLDSDDAMFLSFVKKGKKIAYATSLGAKALAKFCPKPLSFYERLIKEYDAVSVREFNAIAQIEELRGKKDVKLLIDPTLFFFKEEWEGFFDLNTPIVEGDYIFYYAFSYPKDVNAVVNEISRRTGMPVYMVNSKSWGDYGAHKEGYLLSPKMGPVAFLNLMKHAKLSVTTSFHGTAFSVIFEKPFWYINSDMHEALDDRATTLMSQLGLMSHFKRGEEILCRDLFEKIDYDLVNDKRRVLKEEAVKFLIKNLK